MAIVVALARGGQTLFHKRWELASTPMKTGLENRTVLITGAANGIGRATALAFAREGAHLALIDCDAGQLEKTQREVAGCGAGVYSVVADLSSAAGCSTGLDQLLQQLPNGVDVL